LDWASMEPPLKSKNKMEKITPWAPEGNL